MRAGVMLLVAVISVGAVPDAGAVVEEWVARYGWARGAAIAVDVRGGVCVAGDVGMGDAWVSIKYDAEGNEQWAVTYQDSTGGVYGPPTMAVDPDGDVYVVGSAGYPLFATTIKYGSDGSEEWVARYGSGSYVSGNARGVAVDDQGNAYVTGGANADYVTIKYDPDGEEQWIATYDDSMGRSGCADDVVLDASGNVYVTGRSGGTPSENPDYVTIKYDSGGVQQWIAVYDRSYECSADSGDRPNYSDAPAVAVDGRGNVFVIGVVHGDWVTVKYDADGHEEWTATHNGSADVSDWAEDLGVDAEGNVIVTGSSFETGNRADCATIKYDPDGNEVWISMYDGTGSGYDRGYAIAVDDRGAACVTGVCNDGGSRYPPDYLTIRYDSDGNEEYVATYNGPADGADAAYAIALDDDGAVVVTGRSYGDCVTIKYGPESPDLPTGTQVIVDGVARAGEHGIALLFDLDRPADATASIYDVFGHLVAVPVDSELLPEEPVTRYWDLTNEDGERVASGTYFCVVEIGNETTRHRIAVVRG